MPDLSSKLEPFRDFIAAERRKGTTYRRIAELLATEKGVTVDYSTIHAFVKVRSKPRRKVITMLDESDEEPSPQSRKAGGVTKEPRPEPGSDNRQDLSGQLAAIERLKKTSSDKPRPANGLPSFREDAPLDRLSADEARRLREDL